MTYPTLDEHDALVRAVEGGYFDEAIRTGYREASQSDDRRYGYLSNAMAAHAAAAAPRISEFLGREFVLDREGACVGPVTGPFWTAWGTRRMTLLFPRG